jgi:flagellar biosynthesis protein FlhB
VSATEKTEQPTPKKRRDAMREGDVLQSRDLSAALVIGAGVLWLAVAGGSVVAALKTLLTIGLRFDSTELTKFSPSTVALELLRSILGPLGLLGVGTVIAAIAVPTLLGSMAFRWQAVAPKWSRVDPGAGFKRIFGAAGLAELGKSIAKVLLIGTVCLTAVYAARWDLIGLAAGDPTSVAMKAGIKINRALALGALMLAVVALIDVPVQTAQRSRRLAMSRDEVIREHRESDGSPELKRERRGRQYALATMSARSAMKEATVVLTNPTHFAVALRYRPDIDAAPVIVARGCDEAAAAIRDLANGNDVPCLDYPVLTRAIYFTGKVGDRVNQDLYLAVATVLAFVMNIDAALVKQRLQPDVDVPDALRFGANGRREA